MFLEKHAHVLFISYLYLFLRYNELTGMFMSKEGLWSEVDGKWAVKVSVNEMNP